MYNRTETESVITRMDLREFFHDSICSAVAHQKQDITPETIFYLTNLLTEFTHTERAFDHHCEGKSLPALAMLYLEAIEATSRELQNCHLKKLADLSLFISGLFSYSLNKSLIDVDYYVAMGGNAYGYLADNTQSTMNGRAFIDIYSELADKFVFAIDILTEVGDNMNNNNQDIMRLYEIWQRTGSQLAANRLRKQGIDPIASGNKRH